MTIGSFVSFPFFVEGKLRQFSGIVLEIRERTVVVRTIGNDFIITREELTLLFDGYEFDQPVVISDRDHP